MSVCSNAAYISESPAVCDDSNCCWYTRANSIRVQRSIAQQRALNTRAYLSVDVMLSKFPKPEMLFYRLITRESINRASLKGARG